MEKLEKKNEMIKYSMKCSFIKKTLFFIELYLIFALCIEPSMSYVYFT